MNDERSHAHAWLAKAESDRLAARRLFEADGPFDAVCFHGQQACEKALKAVLASAGTEIPRTHNLEELQLRSVKVLPQSSAAILGSLDVSELTPYAVETRYDAEFWPDRDTAEEAVRCADSVVDLISAWLTDVARPRTQEPEHDHDKS
ncbi:MAG: HEPN domain-containing protein [Acidobacteria bacterium]|nr:HEPN domain-containing protein [Acidobacteriota bacterium]